MHAITIGTAERALEVRQRLDDEFRFLQEEGIGVTTQEAHRGRYTFIDCQIPDAAAGSESLIRHYVASALSDLIVEKYEQDLINKIIRDQYFYFSKDEQAEIIDYTQRTLSAADYSDRPLVYKVGRKGRILHRLRDYLDHSSELVLEGFLTFRLQDYLEELEDAVDRAVDDFLMEREHREFIRLLKYFVDVQEPRIDHVNVMMKPGGAFRLVDEAGVAIQSDYLEEFVAEMVESDVGYEDLLISALITLAPRWLTLHGGTGPEWEENIATIQGVFGDRVTRCPGCQTCGQGQNQRPALSAGAGDRQ